VTTLLIDGTKPPDAGANAEFHPTQLGAYLLGVVYAALLVALWGVARTSAGHALPGRRWALVAAAIILYVVIAAVTEQVWAAEPLIMGAFFLAAAPRHVALAAFSLATLACVARSLYKARRLGPAAAYRPMMLALGLAATSVLVAVMDAYLMLSCGSFGETLR
jgi:hypothetical protein